MCPCAQAFFYTENLKLYILCLPCHAAVEYIADLTQTAWGHVLNVWLQLSGDLEPPDVCRLVKCPPEVGKTYNASSTQLTVPAVPAAVSLNSGC